MKAAEKSRILELKHPIGLRLSLFPLAARRYMALSNLNLVVADLWWG